MNSTDSPVIVADDGSVLNAVLTASRALVAMAARSLADVGEEVTLTQYRSLIVIASRGPQGVASLAEAVAVTAPTASRLVDRLVRKGLVRRRADRHDRRQVRIALTQAGRALVDQVSGTAPERDRRLAGLDTSRRAPAHGYRPATPGRSGRRDT